MYSYRARAPKVVKSDVTHQGGSAVLLAAVSIIVLGTGLVLAQLSASKADTAATTAAQNMETGAGQAAALAAAAGATFVNNLSSPAGLCVASTGCSGGVYGSSALAGGASAQSASWWTPSNAHSYSYAGLNSTPLYAVEYVSCDATGLTTYKITGRAVANSSTSVLQGEGTALYYKTVTKNWGVTGSTTGVFINQLYNGVNDGPTAPTLGYYANVVLNASSPGSTINFTSGSTGFINMFDFIVEFWTPPVSSVCTSYIFNISLSKNGGAVTTYNAAHNNLYYNGTHCYQASYTAWDSNTSYGVPISPGFAVTSGDTVRLVINSVNYTGQVLSQGVTSNNLNIDIKMMGTKTGAPNCPS